MIKINTGKIGTPDSYLKIAFGRMSKIGKIKSKNELVRKLDSEMKKIKNFAGSLADDIDRITKVFPDLSKIGRFYLELLEIYVGLGKLKKALAGLRGSRRVILRLLGKYCRDLTKAKNVSQIEKMRKEFIGRVSSVIKKNKNDFAFLDDARKKIRGFPSLKTNIFTVCIFGFPNVGKSTLVKKMSDANVKVESYAFTTKRLLIGYIEKKVQLVDTPGTLDRLDKMNDVEKQAYLALKYLADAVVVVLDVTESCGFDLKSQRKLLDKVSKMGKEVVVYISKTDMVADQHNVINLDESLKKDFVVFVDDLDLREYLVGLSEEK